jgi:hypothetical protein
MNSTRYPGIEAEPIVIQKKKKPDWKPLTLEEARKRQFYLKGIQGEEFLEAEANDLIKQSFSWETASQEEINKRNIQVAVTRFQKKKGDTGSTPVQS